MGFRGDFIMRYYTIKELCNLVDRTAPTIYAYMKKDEETKSFFVNHRKVSTKGGYLYDEEVLELLKNQYSVSDAVTHGEKETEKQENPHTNPAPIPDNEAILKELEEVKAKYAALQTNFDELLRQNGNLSDSLKTINLILAQEKKEKLELQKQLEELKMLPPPQHEEQIEQTEEPIEQQEEQQNNGFIRRFIGLFKKK